MRCSSSIAPLSRQINYFGFTVDRNIVTVLTADENETKNDKIKTFNTKM